MLLYQNVFILTCERIFLRSQLQMKLSVVQNTRGFKYDLHNIKIKLIKTDSTISIKSNVEKVDQI
jgi:hypothetical protein